MAISRKLVNRVFHVPDDSAQLSLYGNPTKLYEHD